MADNESNPNAIFVTDHGAPEGQVFVHDTSTGNSVQAAATEAGYCQAIRDLNNNK